MWLCFYFVQQVQSKVTLKYDSWHKEVLSKFGGMLSNEMTDFHRHVSKVGLVPEFYCLFIQDLKGIAVGQIHILIVVKLSLLSHLIS